MTRPGPTSAEGAAGSTDTSGNASRPGPGGAAEPVRGVELAVSLVLRAGVVVSIAVIAAGLALMFVHHPMYRHAGAGFSYHRLTSSSTRFPDTLRGLETALRAGEGRGIVVLGVLLLVLTPVVRVAVSVVAFVCERDRPMTLVTLFVLVALVGSFLLGGVLR